MKKQTSRTEMEQTVDLLGGMIDTATPCGNAPHSPAAAHPDTTPKKPNAGTMANKKHK